MKNRKKNRDKGTPQHNWQYYLKLCGIAVPIIGLIFWAGYYTNIYIKEIAKEECPFPPPFYLLLFIYFPFLEKRKNYFLCEIGS